MWFPDEKVIRLIERDCFRAMDPEADKAAWQRYGSVVKHRANIAIILQHVDALPAMIAAIEKSLPVARAIDGFRSALHAGEIGKFVKGLRRRVTEGELHVSNPNGPSRRYAVIEGHAIFERWTDLAHGRSPT